MSVTSTVLAILIQSAVPQPAAATEEEPPKEKLVCRRIEITGTLARKERVCKTRAEWRRLSDQGNSVARDIVDWSRTRPAGGP